MRWPTCGEGDYSYEKNHPPPEFFGCPALRQFFARYRPHPLSLVCKKPIFTPAYSFPYPLRMRYLWLLFGLLALRLPAQPLPCGQDEPALWPRYAAHLRQLPASSGRTDSLLPVPLVVHLVARTNGNGRASVPQLLDLLCELNPLFAPAGLRFFLPPDGIRLVNNDGIYLQHTLSANQQQMLAQRDGAALNVFVVFNAGATPNSGVVGYYDTFRDWVVIQRDQIRPGNRTLAHEIGHFFSLLHPHFGWDAAAWDSTLHGNPPGPLAPDGTTPVERVDGSNCQTAGDHLCDTPPDYNFGLSWTQSCGYAGGALDPAGQPVDPDEQLIMGYFSDSCRALFSGEQIALMRLDHTSPARDYLRQPPPDTVSLPAAAPLLLAPLFDATTATADSVRLRWSQVPGVLGYLVEVDRSPAFDLTPRAYLTPDTTLLLTGLLPSQRYHWRVRSYRSMQTCGSFSAPIPFVTGFSTSLATPPGLTWTASFASGQLHLQTASPRPLRGPLRLYSAAGQLIWEQALDLPPGPHDLTWSLPAPPPGLYLLCHPQAPAQRLWHP